MRNEKDDVVVESTLLHEVFDIEFRIASVAERTAAKQEYGIDFALSEKHCCVIATFKVGGLTVKNGDPLDVFNVVVLDKPMPAFFKDDVCDNGDCEQN